MSTETINASAIGKIETVLKASGATILGFSDVVPQHLDKENKIGGDVLPAGNYVSAVFKVIVPI